MWRLILPAILLAPSVVHADPLVDASKSWPEAMVAARNSLAHEGLANLDAPAFDRLCRDLWENYPEVDWFLQDNPNARPGSDDVDLRRDFQWYFEADRDASAEQQMIHRVLAEVPEGSSELEDRLTALAQMNASPADPRWLELYVDACQLRRLARLEPLSRLSPRFIFTRHYTLGGSHYAYTEGQSDAQAERHFVPGAALCLAEWDGRQITVTTLLEDEGGVIRDPDVSFDGRRVLFSWKKSDREDDYHLYEMDMATREIRQLTDGLGVADYEPAYLPDGDIIFNSSRCVQTVDCWWTEVSNLYRCDGHGKLLRRLAFDQVHDNYPTVTEDGRILYTRWEYNDRGQVYPQPLLQMNADGTNQREFYGANSWFPTTILHARGIPGTKKVLAIASGHHSRQTGKLICIDPTRGTQENAGVQLVAPQRETPAVKVDALGQRGELFQYPYPLSEDEYLVTYHPVGWAWKEGSLGPRFGVYFVTRDGRRELLVRDARLPCSQSVPLQARTPRHRVTSQVDYAQAGGTCYIQDVYAGPGLSGIERGAVKRLRVVSIEFRAAGVGSNSNGGPAGGALVSTPVAVGNGTWDPKIILGDATVYEDGSAFFEVPARTPIYFQLLDENGHMVQSMRSWTTLQPGENASCVGCHEDKNSTPVSGMPLTVAVEKGAEQLQPFFGPTRGFSFSREIQPILDENCTRCHDGGQDKPFRLTDQEIVDSRAKRRWSASYLALTHARPDAPTDGGKWRGDPNHEIVNWISTQSGPPMLPPYSFGAARSKLIKQLMEGHENVSLSREEMEKLAAWIDLGVPYCGDYVEANAWSPAEMEKYERYAAKRQRLANEELANVKRLAGQAE